MVQANARTESDQRLDSGRRERKVRDACGGSGTRDEVGASDAMVPAVHHVQLLPMWRELNPLRRADNAQKHVGLFSAGTRPSSSAALPGAQSHSERMTLAASAFASLACPHYTLHCGSRKTLANTDQVLRREQPSFGA